MQDWQKEFEHNATNTILNIDSCLVRFKRTQHSYFRFADRKKQREEEDTSNTSSTYQRRAWDTESSYSRSAESPVTSSNGQVRDNHHHHHNSLQITFLKLFRELLEADQATVLKMKGLTQDTATTTVLHTRYVLILFCKSRQLKLNDLFSTKLSFFLPLPFNHLSHNFFPYWVQANILEIL